MISPEPITVEFPADPHNGAGRYMKMTGELVNFNVDYHASESVITSMTLLFENCEINIFTKKEIESPTKLKFMQITPDIAVSYWGVSDVELKTTPSEYTQDILYACKLTLSRCQLFKTVEDAKAFEVERALVGGDGQGEEGRAVGSAQHWADKVAATAKAAKPKSGVSINNPPNWAVQTTNTTTPLPAQTVNTTLLNKRP